MTVSSSSPVPSSPSAGAELRFAMLGMIEGNGHPFSWSAIVNGYNPEKMAQSSPGIAKYLGEQPFASVRIPGARVTHVWTDRPEEGPLVSAASLVPHVVSDPRQVIGAVDGVFISTDDGDDHVGRAAPFVEAGLPVFIDKPMATNVPDLARFIRWQRSGRFIVSSSGMRYAPELDEIERRRAELGELRWIASFTSKSWERYGIHALESAYRLLGPGLESVRAVEVPKGVIAHVQHRSGIALTIPAIYDALGSFGVFQVCGTQGQIGVQMNQFYLSFRAQLVSFIEAVRTRTAPHPFEQTIELMCAIIAGRESRKRGGEPVAVSAIRDEVEAAVARLP